MAEIQTLCCTRLLRENWRGLVDTGSNYMIVWINSLHWQQI